MIARAHSGPQPHSPALVLQLSEEVADLPGHPFHPRTVAVPDPLFADTPARCCSQQPVDPLEPLQLSGPSSHLVLRCQSGGPRYIDRHS